MEMTDPKYITSKNQVAEVSLTIHDNPTSIIIERVGLANHPTMNFSFALIAYSPDKPDFMLGYSGFYKHPLLIDVDPDFLELGMLKVDPEYFQHRIGSTLIEYSHSIAKKRKKRLILMPERPGQFTLEGYRVREYPMTDNALRNMYKRHGFREFTPEEIKDYEKRKTEVYLDDALWGEGIIPETREFTGQNPLKPVIKKRMATIPFEEKINLMGLVLKRKYGHSRALYINRETNKNIVKRHLIAKE